MLTIYIIANRTIKVFYIENVCYGYSKMEYVVDTDEEFQMYH